MESFRSKYEDLIAKEADIRKYLRKSKEQLKRPREKVLLWLEDVERLEGKVENFEELLVKNSATCFCLSCTSSNSKHPKSVIEMFKEVDRLYKTCQFPDGLLLQQSVGRAELVPIPETGNMSVNEKIWDSLMDNRIGKIGIYGMAGVGKTTCIAWINNQLVTKENYFDIIIWVFVSMDFSLKRIQDNIAQRLGLNLSMYEDEEIRAVHLHERLTQAKQYLIIFDDVWEPIPLEKLGIHEPNRENGCKIVLTTRSMEICHKMGTHKNIKIEVLSKKEAWDLFVRNVGDLVLTPEIQQIAKELVDKCGSLPLAIIMIGRALKGAENINILKEALTGMESASPSNKTMQELFMYLKFSFDSLENATARECFLYCAFFPQGYKFETTELIAYWMADNLIHKEEDILKEIDEGLRIIRVLKDASMLELFTNRSGDEFLTVHNLYRGLAINILQEKPGILIKAGLGLMESLNEREWSQRRKISLMKNGIEMLVNNPDCPNLLSMFLLGNPLSNNISASFFSKMPALQVLDISYSRITELSSSVSQLTNLRALFLKHCTKLKKIPSLEKLIQLRALNLCGSSIKELPEGMDQLVNLRSLDFSETTSLENIEAGVIQKLSCLEELHMQGSRFCKMDSPIAAKIFKELRCLKSLTILTLSSAGFEDHLDTIMCLQEQNLKSFSINVYGSTLDIIEDVQEL